MRESLVGFAENIVIPGGPVDGDDPNSWEVQVERAGMPVGARMVRLHTLLLEEVQRCMTTAYGRLIVLMPPGSAKSTYCSSVAPTWFLGKNPGTKVILASFALALAKKHGRKARAIVQQPAYQAAFGASLSAETNALDEWAIEHGPSVVSEYMAGSFQSGITGNRANGVVVDDPIKGRNEADNPSVRARTLNTWEDDILTRLLPGAWIILIQTRWHAEDLAGSILPETYKGESGTVIGRDGMPWRVLNIPAECEHEDDPLGRPVGDGEGGVDGSMLWPEWFKPEHWAIYRAKQRTWNALFQQRPDSEGGNRFQVSWFKRFELDDPRAAPKYMRLYVTSDFAYTDAEDADDPDFTEHYVWGVDQEFGVWALDAWYGQVEMDVGTNELLRLVRRHKVRIGFQDAGISRRVTEPLLRDMQRRGGTRLHVHYLPTIGSKTGRTEAFRGLANSGRIHIPWTPWGDRLIEQLRVFPGRTHDDGVDNCSLIGRAVDELMAGNMPVQEERPAEPKFGSWEWLTQDVEEPKRAPRVL
jgi:predicted phage terminase large subunit-like protein